MPERLKRLGWFIAIWAISVLAIAFVGYAIRLAIAP
jgi:Protein of unknown function (DUF2474)